MDPKVTYPLLHTVLTCTVNQWTTLFTGVQRVIAEDTEAGGTPAQWINMQSPNKQSSLNAGGDSKGDLYDDCSVLHTCTERQHQASA